MKPVYTTIPASLCEYAVVNRNINHLKLYVYLKHISSGHIRFTNRFYEVWAADLEISSRTIRKSLEWLVKNRWITVNSKRNSLRIIGYNQLCKKLKLSNFKSVKYDEIDFRKFKGFCCGAIITYYIRKKIFSDRRNKWPGSKMDGSSMGRSKGSKGFYNLPISYLAKCIGVSKSTANKYKQAAVVSGYLAVKRNINTFCDNSDNKITEDNFYCVAVCEEGFSGRLRKGKKYLKIVCADSIHSEIQLKSKRNKYSEKR